MIIGIPTETKDGEYRVALSPAGVHELVAAGHEVHVQSGAGVGSGITDEAYSRAGAQLVPAAEEAWAAPLVLKVKEPVPEEFRFLREDLVLFTYLHLAADESLTQALLEAGTTAIAYETVRTADGHLPLLAPMSTIAGRLATQVAAYHLMRPLGGSGVLMGGVPGTGEAKVVVLGGGVVGEQAAVMARGLHAEVTVMDVNLPRLGAIATAHRGEILTRYSTQLDVARQVAQADVVIGSVLIPGSRAPKLVTNEMVAGMREGSVLVDVAVDQGGCFEDTHPTTHAAPTYTVHGAVLYAVANMPGSVPVTATAALGYATLPFVSALASRGWRRALIADPALAQGLMTHHGKLYATGVGQAHGIEVTPYAADLGQ